jgi:hypothetical protein
VSDRRIAEMTKDLCLIEAALATDKLKDMVWVNPDKVDEEKPIE